MRRLNLPHGTKRSKTNKWKMKKLQLKIDMVRSIGKQSGEYVESVLKKKKNEGYVMGRICCRKGRF